MSDESPPKNPQPAAGMPPVTFAQFVVSLGSSALVHLGEVDDPASGKTRRDLTLARHTIDVLGILKEKTKGNLDEDEARLVEALLYDLRTKWLQASREGS